MSLIVKCNNYDSSQTPDPKTEEKKHPGEDLQLQGNDEWGHYRQNVMGWKSQNKQTNKPGYLLLQYWKGNLTFILYA